MPAPDFNQAGKIQWLNYDWIFSQSTRECSVCLSQQEIQAILTVLEPLGWLKRWYSIPNTSIDQDTIEALRDGLEKKLMSVCCDGQVTLQRTNADGSTEISLDDGTTWQPNPDDPRVSGITYPPLPTPEGTDVQCRAAGNVTDFIKMHIQEFTSNIGTAGGAFALAAVAVDLLLALFAVTTGFLPLVPVFLAMAAQAIALGDSAYAALFTDGVYDDFTCIIYCHTPADAVYTHADLLAILTDIDLHFTGTVALTFSSQVKGLQETGLTNAGRTGLSDVSDCSDCSCDCTLTNWNVHPNSPNYFGTITDRNEETGEITVETDVINTDGKYYIYIHTGSADSCCLALSRTETGTTSPEWSHILCGTEIDFGNLVVGLFPTSTCVNALMLRSTTPFTLVVQLTNC